MLNFVSSLVLVVVIAEGGMTVDNQGYRLVPARLGGPLFMSHDFNIEALFGGNKSWNMLKIGTDLRYKFESVSIEYTYIHRHSVHTHIYVM